MRETFCAPLAVCTWLPSVHMVFFLGEREGIVHLPAIAAEICGVARDTMVSEPTHLKLKTVVEKMPEVPLCPGFCAGVRLPASEGAAVNSPVYSSTPSRGLAVETNPTRAGLSCILPERDHSWRRPAPGCDQKFSSRLAVEKHRQETPVLGTAWESSLFALSGTRMRPRILHKTRASPCQANCLCRGGAKLGQLLLPPLPTRRRA